MIRVRGPERRRSYRSNDGAAAVEFALVLSVLLLILLGILDFGRLLYVQQTIKAASREGARARVVTVGSDTAAVRNARAIAVATDSAGPARAMSMTSLAADPPALTFDPSVTPPATPTCTTGGSTTMTVSQPFRWLFVGPLIGRPLDETLTSSTTMRCE